jgi:hypothetical protein
MNYIGDMFHDSYLDVVFHHLLDKHQFYYNTLSKRILITENWGFR